MCVSLETWSDLLIRKTFIAFLNVKSLSKLIIGLDLNLFIMALQINSVFNISGFIGLVIITPNLPNVIFQNNSSYNSINLTCLCNFYKQAFLMIILLLFRFLFVNIKI